MYFTSFPDRKKRNKKKTSFSSVFIANLEHEFVCWDCDPYIPKVVASTS